MTSPKAVCILFQALTALIENFFHINLFRMRAWIIEEAAIKAAINSVTIMYIRTKCEPVVKNWW